MAANPYFIQPANPLAALMAGGEAYGGARKWAQEDAMRSAAAAAAPDLASGDYGAALAKLGQAGAPLDVMMGISKLAYDRKQQEDFSKQFGGILGGGGQPAAEPAPAAAAAQPPVPAMVPGRPSPLPPAQLGAMPEAPATPVARPEVQPSSTVWGDREAEAAGLYEPAKGATAASPNARVADTFAAANGRPSAAPPIPAVPTANPAGGKIQQLMVLMAHPGIKADQKKGIELALQRELDNSKLNEDQKNYVWYRAQGGQASFVDFVKDVKSAGVQGKAQTAFEVGMDTAAAKRWNGYIEGGQVASKALVDIDNMREISRRMGSQGAAAGVKEAIGPYAEALGINIAGLSDLQAYSSIIQRLAPQQRAPGSGSTSDIEFKGFLKSLPTMMQNPNAREMTLDTMEALARHQQAEAAIASRLAAKEITHVQAERELRALPDPMKGFREWRKANPQALSAPVTGQAAPGPDGWSVVDGVRIRARP